MEPAVGGLQLGDGDAQVALGGDEAAVAEDFLNVAQVGFVLEQVGGAGVPPDVAGDVLFHAGHLRALGDDAVEGGAAQGPRLAGKEEPGGGAIPEQLRSNGVEVGFQEPAGHGRKRGHAVALALARVDAKEFFFEVHVADFESEQLGFADARGVKDFQKGCGRGSR